ncbi:MAG TPA: hypothetical protein VFD82_04935 [Planctomycetota bacterium]|nr:hypothetical protein [Planctomycetota bacterium]
MNSLLVGALGVIDVYYLNQDIFLLASLVGWTDQPHANNPLVAAIALGCVVIVWLVHKRVVLRAR